MDNIEYTLHRLDAGRLQDLDKLHEAVYGFAPSPGHFVQKYRTAYTGVEYVGYIAYALNGVPVAYYGVIPCRLQCGDRRILAAQSADTMTHPGYRMKGMFVELSRICFALCQKLGIRVLFGFPNDHSYHGAIKLGWQAVGRMDRFTIPVRSIPLPGIVRRLPMLRGLYRRYCERVLGSIREESPGLENSFGLQGFGGVCRDEAYLHYKTYHPTHVIRIDDLRVWIRIRDGLLLGDLVARGRVLTSEDCVYVIDRLKKLARRLGLPYVTFIVSEDTHVHRLFTGLYSPSPSYPVLVQDFGAQMDLHRLRFSFADLDIF